VVKLEAQLPLIFGRAEKWKAVLLLDQGDVFLEQRTFMMSTAMPSVVCSYEN
jgi:hypothetical protein